MTQRRAIVQIEDGSLSQLPTGDSLVDDQARRRGELYLIQQTEIETLALRTRACERVPNTTFNRSAGRR